MSLQRTMRRDSITHRVTHCKPSTVEPCDIGEVNSKLKSDVRRRFETCSNHVLVFHFILWRPCRVHSFEAGRWNGAKSLPILVLDIAGIKFVRSDLNARRPVCSDTANTCSSVSWGFVDTDCDITLIPSYWRMIEKAISLLLDLSFQWGPARQCCMQRATGLVVELVEIRQQG
jgi:hypothetical protein